MASGKGWSRAYHPAGKPRCDSLSRCDVIFTGEHTPGAEDLSFLTPSHLCEGGAPGAPSRALDAGAVCRGLQRHHTYYLLVGYGVAESTGLPQELYEWLDWLDESPGGASAAEDDLQRGAETAAAAAAARGFAEGGGSWYNKLKSGRPTRVCLLYTSPSPRDS